MLELGLAVKRLAASRAWNVMLKEPTNTKNDRFWWSFRSPILSGLERGKSGTPFWCSFLKRLQSPLSTPSIYVTPVFILRACLFLRRCPGLYIGRKRSAGLTHTLKKARRGRLWRPCQISRSINRGLTGGLSRFLTCPKLEITDHLLGSSHNIPRD